MACSDFIRLIFIASAFAFSSTSRSKAESDWRDSSLNPFAPTCFGSETFCEPAFDFEDLEALAGFGFELECEDSSLESESIPIRSY